MGEKEDRKGRREDEKKESEEEEEEGDHQVWWHTPVTSAFVDKERQMPWVVDVGWLGSLSEMVGLYCLAPKVSWLPYRCKSPMSSMI